MKFKYSKFPAQSSEAFPEIKEVWRPVIPIKIINKTKEYGYLALVDSGADFCIFHGEIGELLGIPVNKGRTSPLFGVTSGEGFVGFSYDLKYPLGILGQKGFFEFFQVMFDFKKKIVDLRPKYL